MAGVASLLILSFVSQCLSGSTALIVNCPSSAVIVNNSDVARWEVPTATGYGGLVEVAVTLNSTHPVGGYFPLGDTNVTYQARDSAGIEGQCTFTVKVVSDGSPEVTGCPENQAVTEVTAEAGYAPVTWATPTAMNPGGGVVAVNSNYNPGDAFPVGVAEVVYTFTNDAGKSSDCHFKVEVLEIVDRQRPTVITPCPGDITVQLPPGVSTVNVSWAEPTFRDDVDGNNLHISRSKPPGSGFREGLTQVLYVAMDTSYNSVSCVFSVIVNITDDDVPPTIQGCPNDINMWVAMGTTEVNVTWTPPTVTDNYSDPAFVSTADPGTNFGTGTTLVNYTATDIVNNIAVCSFAINIMVDDQPPTITGCPGNIVEYVKADVVSLAVTWPVPTVTDNSGPVESASSVESGHVFLAGVTRREDPVTLTFTDGFGNSAECVFTVSVLVDTPPDITCPRVIRRDNIPGQSFADVSWTEVTTVDDYTPFASLQIVASQSEPLRVYIGSPATVTYMVTDERGNEVTCTFDIRITDVEPPVLQGCPSNITQGLDPGTNSAIVSWVAPTATDNSGAAPAITSTNSNPELFYAGRYTVRYTATDAASNTDLCEFIVIVEVDSNVPVFDNCPVGTLNFRTDAGAATTTVTWSAITATDDRDASVTITSNYASGQELSIGTYNIEYQAVDTKGNTGYCGFTVVVADLERPDFITPCPSSQSHFVLNGARDVLVTWPVPEATDNSGSVTVTRTAGRAPGSRFLPGTWSVVYRAVDPTGNFAECTFPVDVSVKGDTIGLSGRMVLDQVRSLDGIFGGSTRQNNLQNDLDDLFRSTALSQDFVGIEIATSGFNIDNDFAVGYVVYLCASSHYNEEDIDAFFYGALTGEDQDSFAMYNIIVRDSFDLNVVEFHGQFTLRSIQSPGTVAVSYQACCSDPASGSYQTLLNRIYDHFDRTYGTDPSYRMSKILFLEAGSVVVDYTLTYDPQDSPGAAALERTFNSSVAPADLELVEGANTGLYLARSGLRAGSIQEVCSVDYCLNGGTCSVSDRLTYEVECSCISRYYGERCELRGLSIEAIVGIAVGSLMAVLLLLIVCLSCCYCALFSGRQEEEEEARRRRMTVAHPPRRREQPLHLLYEASPKVDPRYVNIGFVHEVVSEVPRRGPAFKHEAQNGHARGRPKGPTQARAQGPSTQNGLSYQVTDDLVAPEQQRGRKKSKKPLGKGPHFGHDMTQTKGTQELEQKKRKKREKGPSFHAEEDPEPVLQLKERLFQEFSY